MAICHLNGWAKAIPIPDERTKTMWKALNTEIISRWDYPQEIVTDNGAEFVADDTRALFRFNGIRHLRTTPLHAQTNGAIERFNQSLKQTLTKLVNNQPDRWGEELAQAMWAYRRAPQVGRGGRSLFQILFGV